jgi:hypothetical protein
MLQDVTISVGDKSKEAAPDEPSAFCWSLLVWSLDVCIFLGEGSIICLMGDASAIEHENAGC